MWDLTVNDFSLYSGILLLGFFITTMVKILLLYRWDLIADVLFEHFDCGDMKPMLKEYSGLNTIKDIICGMLLITTEK